MLDRLLEAERLSAIGELAGWLVVIHHEGSGDRFRLSHVKRIVEAHGGTITARTEIGKGTAFKITLIKRALEKKV